MWQARVRNQEISPNTENKSPEWQKPDPKFGWTHPKNKPEKSVLRCARKC